MSDTANDTFKKPLAIVTGASRGIGHAIAITLADQGFYVVGTATTAQGVHAISTALGAQGEGALLDVRDRQAIQQLVHTVEAQWGAVNCLVNNAGITKDGLLMRMKDADWQDIMDVHVNATFEFCRAVIKGMAKARYGSIVNIGSVVAQMGNAGQCNYVAAKAAIEGFSRALAVEMGARNITVNVVAPGFIATDLTAVLTEQQQQQMKEKIPLQRLGSAQDVANVVAFLAGTGGRYITGAVIPVNGGMYLG